MQLSSATISRFRLPLRQPLQFKGHQLDERQGFILQLKVDNGQVGLGECSPLPGFSRETLGEAFSQLQDISDALLRLPEHIDSIIQSGARVCIGRALYPSVAFALDCAALTSGGLLRSAPVPEAVCPLLTGTPEQVMAQFSLLPACTEIKLKVGRGKLNDDIELVNVLCEQASPSLRIRLDANRLWSFAEAERFCRSVNAERVAFLEEPLATWQRLPELGEMTGFPLALDESIQVPDWCFRIFPGLVALVVKPMLVGGIIQARTLIRRAREAGLRAVVSASYESPLGIQQLGWLACRETPDELPGLDTLGVYDPSAVARFERAIKDVDNLRHDPVLEQVWHHSSAAR